VLGICICMTLLVVEIVVLKHNSRLLGLFTSEGLYVIVVTWKLESKLCLYEELV